jgi:soluble lytic murein transglycosylase-like protein
MLSEISGLKNVIDRIAEIRQRFPAETQSAGNFRALLATPPEKTPQLEDSWEATIKTCAEQYDLDPALIKAVMRAESAFNPLAVSRSGAQGLMQLMPGTARALGVADVFDPQQNIAGGCRYLRQMLDASQGDVSSALASYNAGPVAVKRYGGIPPFPETQNYVRQVLYWLEQYRNSSSR